MNGTGIPTTANWTTQRRSLRKSGRRQLHLFVGQRLSLQSPERPVRINGFLPERNISMETETEKPDSAQEAVQKPLKVYRVLLFRSETYSYSYYVPAESLEQAEAFTKTDCFSELETCIDIRDRIDEGNTEWEVIDIEETNRQVKNTDWDYYDDVVETLAG